TSRPKGKSIRTAILKHCNPNGIPMMVKHKTSPAVMYSNAVAKPPNNNQIILPIKFMCYAYLGFMVGLNLGLGAGLSSCCAEGVFGFIVGRNAGFVDDGSDLCTGSLDASSNVVIADFTCLTSCGFWNTGRRVSGVNL